MSHKVHPKSFRLRWMQDWESRGFYEKNEPRFLREEFYLRQLLEKELAHAGVSNIKVDRSGQEGMKITICTARPGLVIGRGGEKVEELKMKILKLMKKLTDDHLKIQIQIEEIKNPWASAALTGQWIAQELEKRVRFRRAVTQALQKVVASREVKGVRIRVAGRLDGADIAREETFQEGQMPRHTIRADIDYALSEARCTYGTIGIKVWIYRGEKPEEKVED
ncbi:MAG TPA: 30S ribosomal protein S3 [Candidatus Pacearchaeota archaeon]|nr:30S ribosomal protein S3 [Candidatus Pacearchaeota archaeon]